MELTRYPCPCCGYYTLDQKPSGTYDTCPVCWWEDDIVQLDDPTYAGGANKPSLNEARANFQNIRVSDPRLKQHAREPQPEELPENNKR